MIDGKLKIYKKYFHDLYLDPSEVDNLGMLECFFEFEVLAEIDILIYIIKSELGNFSDFLKLNENKDKISSCYLRDPSNLMYLYLYFLSNDKESKQFEVIFRKISTSEWYRKKDIIDLVER